MTLAIESKCPEKYVRVSTLIYIKKHFSVSFAGAGNTDAGSGGALACVLWEAR